MSFEFYDTQFKASPATLQASATTSNEIKDFRKLAIWQLSIGIVHKVYDLLPNLPMEERYGMRSHMKRSATAIATKIEEACAQLNVIECGRVLEMALTHAYELDTQLAIVERRKWEVKSVTQELIGLIREEQTMLKEFIEKIKVG
jgi:four helix bundle protein